MSPAPSAEPRTPTRYRGRTFDVQPSTDDRSVNYPVAALLAAAPPAPEPVRKVWRRSATLDQGQEGACVGHGVTAELMNYPVPVNLTKARLREPMGLGAPKDPQAFAFWLYRTAQRYDPWPGESYSGTSVNAGMKVARDAGLYDAYYWAFSWEEFTDALQRLGPVVIAIPWYDGMYETQGARLTVSGEQVGWHCLLANGYDPAGRFKGRAGTFECVRLQNSWGPGWGNDGLAWILAQDLRPLLERPGADMVIPHGRRYDDVRGTKGLHLGGGGGSAARFV